MGTGTGPVIDPSNSMKMNCLSDSGDQRNGHSHSIGPFMTTDNGDNENRATWTGQRRRDGQVTMFYSMSHLILLLHSPVLRLVEEGRK